MFGITTYLAETISALVPWWATAGALYKLRGIDDERGGELTRLKGLFNEGRVDTEEIEKLKEEFRRFRRELGGAGAKDEVEEMGEEMGMVEMFRELKDVVKAEMVRRGKERDEAKAGEAETMRMNEELKGEIVRLKKKSDSVGKREVGVGEGGEVQERESMPEDELIKHLHSSNKEIRDLAQTIADSVPGPPPRENEAIEEDRRKRAARIREVLGEEMVESLQGSTQINLKLGKEVVMLALEAIMIAYTHSISSSWYFDSPEDEHMSGEVYAGIAETEQHWCTLMPIHLQRILATEPGLMIRVVDVFVDIILTAGWYNDADALRTYLMRWFGHRVSGVLERAKRLSKIIGEMARSDSKLEAFYITPGAVFNDTTMELGGGLCRGEEGGQTVLCTTNLGLVKVEKRAGDSREWDKVVLLKPTVVLQ